ncbi:MAG: hypothetical protein KDE27_26285, partial [Planctomycetes bacterium]|nr:hypothetical protein [Planctomycetota bacterium]
MPRPDRSLPSSARHLRPFAVLPMGAVAGDPETPEIVALPDPDPDSESRCGCHAATTRTAGTTR